MKVTVKSQFLERHAFSIAVLYLFICFGIAYLPPNRITTPSHDFLDSGFVYLVLLSNTGYFPKLDATIPILNGLTLSGININDFMVVRNIFTILPPLSAFAVSQSLTRGLAFVGCFFLIKDYILPEFGQRRLVAAGAGIVYALLPYWDDTSGTMATLPLVIYSILNIIKSRLHVVSWLILLTAPFFWTFVYGGFAVIIVSGCFTLYAIATGKIYWPKLLMATVALTALSLAVEYRTLWLLFFTDFVAHRTEFDFPPGSFTDFLLALKDNIIFGDYHFFSGQFPIILFAIIIAIVIITMWPREIRNTNGAIKLFLVLIGLSVLISTIFAAENSGFTKFTFWFPIPFWVGRLNVFHPLIITIIFSLAVALICLRFPKYSLFIAATFTILAISQVVLNAHSLGPKVLNAFGPIGKALNFSSCGFWEHTAQCSQTNMQRYYRVSEYREIARQIGRPLSDYWVASVDVDPMIAAFNRFQTIDGYAPLYPLDYKHKFDRIIAKELERDPTIADYFRKWGSRVYLFRRPGMPLLIDFCEASNVGAEYVLTPLNLAGVDTLTIAATASDLKAYEIVKGKCKGTKKAASVD